MVRFPRWLAVGFLVSAALVAACKKDSDSGGAAGGGGGAGTQDLHLLPVDSELVMGINVAQAQKSSLFREYVLPQLTKDPNFQKLNETFKSKCNLDPMTSVSSVSIGVKSLSAGNPDGVIVFHGVDKAKSLTCFDQMKEELAREKVDVAKDGDVVIVKGAEPDQVVALTFVDDSTAIAVIGPNANKAGVLEAAKGKSALKTSKQFVDMHSQIKSGQTMWMLLNGAAEPLAGLLSKVNVKSKAVFGSVNVTDGLAFDMRMRVESDEQASQVASMIQSQVGPFGGMVDKLEVASDKSDVRVVIDISQEKLKGLMSTMRSLFGGRRGGGGGGFSFP